jgi:hypothetical protein
MLKFRSNATSKATANAGARRPLHDARQREEHDHHSRCQRHQSERDKPLHDLTTRISDPAPLTPDMKPRRYRGVHCIRLVRFAWRTLARSDSVCTRSFMSVYATPISFERAVASKTLP